MSEQIEMKLITAEQVHKTCHYPDLVSALEKFHQEAPADLKDMLMTKVQPDAEPDSHLFIRAAWSGGKALGLKSATVFPQNRKNSDLPAIHATYTLFDGVDGTPAATIDGTSMTYYKTAADSALGGKLLARKGVSTMAMIGAGAMAPHLIRAHCEIQQTIREVTIWNRTHSKAVDLANCLKLPSVEVSVTDDLESAVRNAQLVSSATMTKDPIIQGEWISPGTHVDLIGAFTLDMREVDDEALRRSRIFVDSRKTTIGEIGEITIPIETGVIREEDVLADLYDLCSGTAQGRQNDDEITLFKNGGGGHLDLMTAQFIVSNCQGQ